jgi:hypothetical protein
MSKKLKTLDFIVWFTGTSLNAARHPYYGNHQITKEQYIRAPKSYRRELLQCIKDAEKSGYI